MLLKSILNRFSKSVCLSSGKNSNLLQAYKPQTSVVLKSNISYLLNSNISLNSNVLNLTSAHSVLYKDQNYFSISSTKNDLMQFFDEKKNWTEEKVKHGRPWRLEELRIKSNTDLHKLWYVLHKERNMLLTMEEVYKQKGVPMPSHERIAKVDESMENLLSVVEERNIAFNLLETGETKKVLPYRRYNSFGHIQYYRPREYLVPWYLNKMWKLKYHYKKIPV